MKVNPSCVFEIFMIEGTRPTNIMSQIF